MLSLCSECYKLCKEYTGIFRVYNICQSCGHLTIKNSVECCVARDLFFVRFQMSNGAFSLRKICRTCGMLDGRFYKRDSVQNFDTLPIVKNNNVEISKRSWEESQKHIQIAKDIKKGNFDAWYTEYLISEDWKRKRSKVLQRDNYQCKGCLTNPATEVHHLTYDHVGEEFAFELISLCSKCHDRIHQDKK